MGTDGERYEHVLDSDGCVRCPYCLADYWDDLQSVTDGSSFECTECRKTFRVEVEYSVLYTSLVPVQGEPNG